MTDFNFDPTRDYVGEMRALVDELAVGTYFPQLVAHKLVNVLRTRDPELLQGWLFLQAEHMLRMAINDRDRSRRSAARHHTKSVFADMVEDADRTGSTAALERWLSSPMSLSSGARIPLREMRQADLVDAGRQYQTRAETQGLMASFLQALAREVGEGTVGDRYSERQLDEMWRSLAGY